MRKTAYGIRASGRRVRMGLLIAICVLLCVSAVPAAAREPAIRPHTRATIPLWPNGAPGALGSEHSDRPTLTIYLPESAKASGTGVVICPGGSYARHAMDHEGHQVARLMTSRGIAGFILKYRLGPRYHHPAMLQDVLEAIRHVRARAAAYRVRPDRIGVLGFSAGGHLASSAATLFEASEAKSSAAASVSARPDFAVLAYPVIVMGDAITHKRSQSNLLGEQPSPAWIDRLSTDRQVTAGTPPTFLFHTNEDTAVPPENSVRFYLALRRAGIPAELHVYEKGAHGVGLAADDPVLRTWTERLFAWMRIRGLLP
jgi:acetyl esterase/lipase